jgi:L-ascorbate metabolism protein UlaG (beta-lactamase superfamily)
MKLARALPGVLAVATCAGCGEPLKHEFDAAPVPAGSVADVAASARVTDRFATRSGELAVVPLEHAALLFLWHGRAIYVDPGVPAVNDASLPRADVVLVTDAHYDHFDPIALAALRQPGMTVVGPAAANARVPVDVVVHEGDHRTLTGGPTVDVVPAYGSRGPGPGLRYHERGQAVGYVVDFDGTRVYVSGDTECTPEVRALANVDAAFVSLNAPYAMTPDEASACVEAFRPKVVFPYAYRHAAGRLDRAALASSGVEVRRREFYPRAEEHRAKAYSDLTHGMWGAADDQLDEARRLDPESENDWRVRWTRQWLKEYERPWPW